MIVLPANETGAVATVEEDAEVVFGFEVSVGLGDGIEVEDGAGTRAHADMTIKTTEIRPEMTTSLFFAMLHLQNYSSLAGGYDTRSSIIWPTSAISSILRISAIALSTFLLTRGLAEYEIQSLNFSTRLSTVMGLSG